MRQVPSLLVVLLTAVALACGWAALQLLVGSARDAATGGPGVRGVALLMLATGCLLAGVAWQLLKLARMWLGIARRVAQPRPRDGSHRDRTA